MEAASIYAEAPRRGIALRLEGEHVVATLAPGADRSYLDVIRTRKRELVAYLASGWPCPACGGSAGHTPACSHGPGPAEFPAPEEVWAVAAALEFPQVAVQLPSRPRPVIVPGRAAAWKGFLSWAAGRPEALLATFEALERFEAAWRLEAPVPPEEVPA